ncbi:hypothetical protein R84981_000124 [Carnimonas sp. R-84981]|uniref:acyltransferase family protein n=1 Tax=Carnimonas bestiolae TaxID=3402172 RepID=UPI003EDC76B9
MPAAPSSSTHVSAINLMRGAGILMIAFGHYQPGAAANVLFLFHVPLFFFLSGYLMRLKDHPSHYFMRKTAAHLRPYVAYLVLLGIPAVGYLLSEKDTLDVLKSSVEAGILGGQALTGIFSAFWFITCFWISQQLLYFLRWHLPPIPLAISMALMAALAFANDYLLADAWLMGSANVALLGVPIMYAGYLASRHPTLLRSPTLIWAALALMAGSATAIYQGAPLSMNMKYSHYGVPVISLIAALASIVVIVNAAEWLVRCTWLTTFSKQLAYIGQGSMTIMYLHLLIQWQFGHWHIVAVDMLVLASSVALPLLWHWLTNQFAAGVFLLHGRRAHA